MVLPSTFLGLIADGLALQSAQALSGSSSSSSSVSVSGDSPPANQHPAAFYNPALNGGSLLDDAGPGVGEPLNVIISGASDPFVLTEEGFFAYINSIGYARECMGLHMDASVVRRSESSPRNHLSPSILT